MDDVICMPTLYVVHDWLFWDRECMHMRDLGPLVRGLYTISEAYGGVSCPSSLSPGQLSTSTSSPASSAPGGWPSISADPPGRTGVAPEPSSGVGVPKKI